MRWQGVELFRGGWRRRPAAGAPCATGPVCPAPEHGAPAGGRAPLQRVVPPDSARGSVGSATELEEQEPPTVRTVPFRRGRDQLVRPHATRLIGSVVIAGALKERLHLARPIPASVRCRNPADPLPHDVHAHRNLGIDQQFQDARTAQPAAAGRLPDLSCVIPDPPVRVAVAVAAASSRHRPHRAGLDLAAWHGSASERRRIAPAGGRVRPGPRHHPARRPQGGA
jgi:hypothetical protein